LGGIVCSVFKGGETIGREDVISLSGRVGGVDAFDKKITIPMDDCVLKAVER
jgi:hypothetical protein